jgi:outer membrane autotransporter protein
MLTNDSMVYARVGVVKTKFNVKADVSSLGDESSNETVTGGQLGLGLQTKVTQKVDLRGEYVYTGYNSFHAVGEKVNASSGQATVGVVYNFS